MAMRTQLSLAGCRRDCRLSDGRQLPQKTVIWLDVSWGPIGGLPQETLDLNYGGCFGVRAAEQVETRVTSPSAPVHVE